MSPWILLPTEFFLLSRDTPEEEGRTSSCVFGIILDPTPHARDMLLIVRQRGEGGGRHCGSIRFFLNSYYYYSCTFCTLEAIFAYGIEKGFSICVEKVAETDVR